MLIFNEIWYTYVGAPWNVELGKMCGLRPVERKWSFITQLDCKIKKFVQGYNVCANRKKNVDSLKINKIASWM